jgi:hypothetical protein
MQNVGEVEVQPVQILVGVVRLKHFNAVECTSSCGGYCIYSKLMFAKASLASIGNNR